MLSEFHKYINTHSKIESALAYISKGMMIIPLHTPNDGKCSCGADDCSNIGKHPRVTFEQASNEIHIVNEWWAKWPDANIGILTGRENGIIVADIDGEINDVLGFEFPVSLTSKTNKGYHVYYRYPQLPEDEKIRNRTKVGDSHIDSRGDGGYIIAPPSVHKSGHVYTWIESTPAPAPEEWVDLVRGKVDEIYNNDHKIQIQNGQRNEAIFKYACTFVGNGLTEENVLFMAVSSVNKNYCIEPLSDKDVLTIVKSALKYTPEEAKKEIQQIERNKKLKEVESNISEIPDLKKQIERPKIWYPKGGMFEELVQMINNSSLDYTEEFSFMGVLHIFSMLMGNKYSSHTESKANLFTVGLMSTGSGKDGVRKAVRKIFNQLESSHYIGGEEIASGPAIHVFLQKNNVKIFQIDEFGLFLQAVNHKNASSHKAEIAQILMKLFSSSGDEYNGKIYAEEKRNIPTIYNPYLNILGTSTGVTFFEGLTSNMQIDGFLNRLLVIEVDKLSDSNTDIKPIILQKHHIEFLKSIKVDTTISMGVSDNSIIIDMRGPVKKKWVELRESIKRMEGNDIARSINMRVAEYVMKLSMIYAVSKGSTMIEMEDLDIAIGVVTWSFNNLYNKVREHSVSNDYERDVKKVYDFIKSKQEGVVITILYRSFRNIRQNSMYDILKHLIEGGMITIKTIVKENGKGSVDRYIAI